MWQYWLLFAVPAMMAIRRNPRQDALWRNSWSVEQWLFWFFSVFLIGGRYKVGGDWEPHLRYLTHSADLSLYQVISEVDPGYVLINWISNQLGFGIFGVNLMAAAVFSTGLTIFCRSLPRFWLALTISVPYLITVLGMGYVRQGIALSVLMIGIVALQQGRVTVFLLWSVLGATFHKAAIIILPLALLGYGRMHIHKLLMIALIAGGGFFWFLGDSIDFLIKNYWDAGYSSSGALMRLGMNAMAAFLLLSLYNYFDFNHIQRKLWIVIAWITVALFLAYFFSPSSTALDRLALYFIPIQIIVFSSLPDVVMKRFGFNRQISIISVIIVYALSYFFWLFFGVFSYAWLPYRFYLIEIVFG